MLSTIGSEPLNVCHLPALMYGAGNGLRTLEETVVHPSVPWQRFPATAKSRFRPSRRKHRHLERRAVRPEWFRPPDVVGMEVCDQTTLTSSGV